MRQAAWLTSVIIICGCTSAGLSRGPGASPADKAVLIFEWPEFAVVDSFRASFVSSDDPGLLIRPHWSAMISEDAWTQEETEASVFGWLDPRPMARGIGTLVIGVNTTSNVDSTLASVASMEVPPEDSTLRVEHPMSLFFIASAGPVPTEPVTVRIHTFWGDTIIQLDPRFHTLHDEPLLAVNREDLSRIPAGLATLVVSLRSDPWQGNYVPFLFWRDKRWHADAFRDPGNGNGKVTFVGFDTDSIAEWQLYFIRLQQVEKGAG